MAKRDPTRDKLDALHGLEPTVENLRPYLRDRSGVVTGKAAAKSAEAGLRELIPDLAQAFVAVASRPAAASFETLHFAGYTLTGRELLAAIDAAAGPLGLRPAQGFATGTLPWGLMRAVGVVHAPWRELARMRYLWQVPHALDGSRLKQAYQTAPPTPLHEALAQTLVDLGLARKPLQLAHT